MAVSLDDDPPSQGPICPVCFRDYSDNETELIPRILQCGHTYCTQCLERLLTIDPCEDEFEQVILDIRHTERGWRTVRRYPFRHAPSRSSNELKCPTCNTVNRILNGNVSSLTKNFALLSCRPDSTTKVNSKLQSKHYCKEHEHEKRVYCNDCKVLICAYCQLYGDHKKHDCVIATEVAKPAIDALRNAEARLSNDLDRVSLAEKQVSTIISRVEKQKRTCELRVRRHFEDVINKLADRRDAVVVRMGSWVCEQMEILQAQLHTLQEAKQECETILGNCRSLIDNDPLDALDLEKEVTDGMESVHSHVSCLSFQPLIRPSIRCTLSQGDKEAQLSSVMEGCKVVYDIQEEGDNAEDSDGEEEGYEMESAAGYAAKATATSSDDKGEGGKKSASVYSQDTQDPATVPTYFPTTGSTGRFSAFSRIEHPVASVSNWFHLEPLERPASPPPIHVGFGRPSPYFRYHGPHQGAESAAAATTASEETNSHTQLFDLRPTTSSPPTPSTSFLHPIAPKPTLPSSFGTTSFLFSPSMPSMDSDDSLNSDNEPEPSHFPASRYPFTIYLDGVGSLSNSSSLAERQQAQEEVRQNGLFSRQLSSSVVDSLQFRQHYQMNDSSDEEEPRGRGSVVGGSGQFETANGTGPTGTLYQLEPVSAHSAHSDPPSPHPLELRQETARLHLSQAMNLDLDNNSEDEIVVPISHQYSWGSDSSRALRLEIDHRGTAVQLSIEPTGAQDMDLTDPEDHIDPPDED